MRQLARLYEMLDGHGERDGVRLLGRQTVEAVTARHRVGIFDETFGITLDWGLGLGIDSSSHGRHSSRRVFGHGGAQSSIAYCDPQHHLVVAFQTNGMPGTDRHYARLAAVSDAIYEDTGLGDPPPPAGKRNPGGFDRERLNIRGSYRRGRRGERVRGERDGRGRTSSGVGVRDLDSRSSHFASGGASWLAPATPFRRSPWATALRGNPRRGPRNRRGPGRSRRHRRPRWPGPDDGRPVVLEHGTEEQRSGWCSALASGIEARGASSSASQRPAPTWPALQTTADPRRRRVDRQRPEGVDVGRRQHRPRHARGPDRPRRSPSTGASPTSSSTWISPASRSGP